ncbi:MAG TPA: hypothetical protein VMW15_01345 [Terracidiphilus sp.]|nr:hypothetical protein [Terracidiphilus sp.]
MDRMLRGLIVTGFGVATTLLTAAGLVVLELRYDCAIYSFVYAFVLPLGAFLSGLVAASGYYVGSKLLSYRPGRGMLAVLLAISGANFFLIYWLKYVYLTVDGRAVHDSMTFPAYLTFTLSHTSMTTGPGSGDAIELGWAGYLFAALLIAGFALGGLCIYAIVRSAPYCDACGLYLKKKGSQTRYFVGKNDLAACNAAMRSAMDRSHFREAMRLHAVSGSREIGESSGYSLRAGVSQCAGCGKQWLELSAKQRVNKSWNHLAGFRYSAYCTESIDVLEQLAGSS